VVMEHAMNMLTAAEQALAAIPVSPPGKELPQGARAFEWEELEGASAKTCADRTTASRQDVIELRIELGRTQVCREELANLRLGAVVPLDGAVCEPVCIYAGGHLVARGEVLALDGKFAVRVLEVTSAY
jgi:flagellar motor switch protein FliN